MNSLSPSARSELLAGYVLGNLTPAERAMVEEYLATHPAAQQELQNLQSTWMLLPLALPPGEPGAGLRDRILQEATPARRWSLPGLRHWWLLLGVAATLAIGGLGWQNHGLQQQVAKALQQKQQIAAELERSRQQTALALQQAQDRLSIMSRADTRFLPVKAMEKLSGSGSLVLAPVKTKAFLTLQKVPALPTGRVYRIWAVKENGEDACGHFRPDANGFVYMELPLSDWNGANAISITIEQEKAKEAEGPEVMGGEFKI
jgi:Anti-sigma-K factor rskA